MSSDRLAPLLLVCACGSSSTSAAPPSSGAADAAPLTDATTSPSDGASPFVDGASPSDAPSSLSDAGPACALDAAGSLLVTMASIVTAMRAGGNAGSGALAVPAPADRDAFAATVVGVLAGDEHAACALPAPYRLLRLTDPRAGALRVVAELDASGAPAPSRYWGTYVAPVVHPAHGRLLAVEAPHPIFDTNTEIEATDTFVQATASYLLVAGSHRCADAQASGCSGTTTACGASAPYRISDAAHADALPFYAVHAALSSSIPALAFLQLHGNVEACPDALVSDSSGAWSDAGLEGSLVGALSARGVSTGRCGAEYPTTACNLCGGDNVEARLTAGSSNACTTMGPAGGYGRFVHVEQQPALRLSPAAGTTGYQPLIDAVLVAFPTQ